MSPDERAQLVTLLQDPQHWCQGAEARDAEGHDVMYGDTQATAWDLTGAACRLFGWGRACELFLHMDRHLHDRARAGANQHDAEIAAMVALQTWNDAAATTHAELLARLQSLPVSARDA
jgi:hypothetical protein